MGKMPIGLVTTFADGIPETIDKLNSLGIKYIQYLILPDDSRSDKDAREIRDAFDAAGIKITAIFCTYAGMDYSTIQLGIETGGLVPIAYRKERTEETKRIAKLANSLGADAICAHWGAIPENRDDPGYPDLVLVTQDVCDFCRGLSMTVNLETGEDSPETLLNFIHDVDRSNLAINFDPANMILYGKGNPIETLKEVGAYVKSCHCKDAKWSENPGVDWGVETCLGEGEVDVEAFIQTLDEIGYAGPLTIEREVEGDQQITDIKTAITLLKKTKANLT